MLIAVARAKKKLRERIPSGQRRLGKRLAGPRKSGKKFGLESCTRHSQGMEARKEEGQRRQLQDAGTGDTGPGARPALERGCQGPKNEKPVKEAAQGLVELGPRAGRSRQEATGCFGQLFCASVYSSVRCAAYALL